MQINRLFIITNNPLVENIDGVCVLLVDGDPSQVLNKALNLVAEGYSLLTHPLAGSLRPGQSPFRSVLLEANNDDADLPALNCLHQAIKKLEDMSFKSWENDLTSPYQEDYQLLDLKIIEEAVRSIIN